MPEEEKLIDPGWLIKARKDRRKFGVRVLIVFAILSVLAWWALPRLETQHSEILRSLVSKKKDPATAGPTPVRLLAEGTGLFKAFWGVIAIGCGVGVALAFTGKIDSLLPVMNIGVLLLGLGAVVLTFYVFYAPMLLMVEAAR
jgi:hypothetical protein